MNTQPISCGCKNLFTSMYNAVLRPKQCWEDIQSASLSPFELLATIALPLNIAYPIVSRRALFSTLSITQIIIGIASTTILQLTAIVCASWTMQKLAPLFRGRMSRTDSTYLVVYPMIPIWLSLLVSHFTYGYLFVLGAISLSLYSLYQGLVVLGNTPQRSIMQFFSVVVACAVTTYVIIVSINALAALIIQNKI